MYLPSVVTPSGDDECCRSERCAWAAGKRCAGQHARSLEEFDYVRKQVALCRLRDAARIRGDDVDAPNYHGDLSPMIKAQLAAYRLPVLA